MSTRQLQCRMKEGAGLPASGCIRLMRMERAAQLLEKRAGRISEVASAVGYADAKQFSRRFRTRYSASCRRNSVDERDRKDR
jgi:transcriptional regulator GlxA family with amidase domain